MFRVGIVADAAACYLHVIIPCIEEELFNLMAADVAQDASVLCTPEEPVRPACRIQGMRSEAFHVDDPADLPLIDHVASQHSCLHMEPFAEVHHVFPSRAAMCLSGLCQLLKGGEGTFIRKVVLSCRHDPESQATPLTGNGGGAHQLHILILQNFFFAGCRSRLGKTFEEGGYLICIWVIDLLQGCACIKQSPGHAVNVSVLQVHHGKDKFPRFHHRAWPPVRCILHTIATIHVAPSFTRRSACCCPK